ncbi:hypothetical protein G3R49_03965 [Shewanella sp. WXL01]|uniref:DUF998 domain-containing protein n=1 Tax=Shewanella maritima TaxID=2520507 RepID=A0A411PF15_9GAMM|nr:MULTISPECIES: hypothetical protein [Shewanella]NKF49732.1 hypothetical protein [Shewanella sp. WXL01]QBF82187.1 hypothetical protein EXU30_05335 [Shewanella maritima]
MTQQKRISNLAFRFGALGIFGIALGWAIAILIEVDSLLHIPEFMARTSLSELGTYSKSPAAVFLNGGLFFGSLSVALSCLLALQLSKGVAHGVFWFALALQFITLAATGLFPMNVHHLHMNAVFAYLCSGVLLAVSLLSVSKYLSPKLMWLARVIAFWVVVAHVALLVIPQYIEMSQSKPLLNYLIVVDQITSISPKPEIWWQAMTYWSSLACVVTTAIIKLNAVRSSYR